MWISTPILLWNHLNLFLELVSVQTIGEAFGVNPLQDDSIGILLRKIGISRMKIRDCRMYGTVHPKRNIYEIAFSGLYCTFTLARCISAVGSNFILEGPGCSDTVRANHGLARRGKFWKIEAQKCVKTPLIVRKLQYYMWFLTKVFSNFHKYHV